MEAASEHPIAHAIAAAALPAESRNDDGGRLPAVEHFRSAPGGGVAGTVEGRLVTAGRTGWLQENGITITAEQQEALQTAEESGATAIWVAVDGKPAGIISLRDTIKPGSAAAIARLKQLGLRPILLTGDNAAVAAQVAAAVGIAPDDVFAGVLPEGKVEAVRKLQAGGATVAMAGDGVNDAAALAQADLGIAMGSGTDVAIEAADLTVMGNDLGQVAQAIELSRRTLATIKTNLFWAFFYNAVGIPVAALGLLNPMIAGAAMAASSVLVVANSLRLRSFGKARPGRPGRLRRRRSGRPPGPSPWRPPRPGPWPGRGSPANPAGAAVTWAISCTASLKASSLALDGLVLPLILRTYCSAAACTSRRWRAVQSCGGFGYSGTYRHARLWNAWDRPLPCAV